MCSIALGNIWILKYLAVEALALLSLHVGEFIWAEDGPVLLTVKFVSRDYYCSRW